MVTKLLRILFFLFLITAGYADTCAADFAVENADGVLICYNYINLGKELEVTQKRNGELPYVGDIVIPSEVTYNNKTLEVTAIGKEAFNNCSNLKSIIIPNSVNRIGDNAFTKCLGLTSIIIPDNVTSIGNSAFKGCHGIASFSIPNKVVSIGEEAFASCSSLTSIDLGNGLTTIGKRAFDNCRFTSISIPTSVSFIDDAAFYNCINLTSVNIMDIAAWCNIKFVNHPSNPLNFAHNLYLNGVEVKDLIIPDVVSSIGDIAFSECNLSTVTIPNSVETIGEDAFMGCSSLSSVIIGNSVSTIGNYAFSGCSGLTSVTIPNSVTTIGDGAFGGCDGLTSIVIPDNVTTIGKSAFSGCDALLSVIIGNGVTTIGNKAFYSCANLLTITIGKSVTSIGYNAFERSNITTIVSLIEHLFNINDSQSDYRAFSLHTFRNSILYVPVGRRPNYKAYNGWEDFEHIEEGIPSDITNTQCISERGIIRYSIDGNMISTYKKGINIIKMKSGTVKKVFEK